MSPKWIGLLVLLWVMAALVGSVSEGTMLVANSTRMAPAQGLMSFTEVRSEQDFGIMTMPSNLISYFGNIFKVITLDFPIFGDEDSPWQLVRWIVLGPIIGTVVFGLVVMFFYTVRQTL